MTLSSHCPLQHTSESSQAFQVLYSNGFFTSKGKKEVCLYSLLRIRSEMYFYENVYLRWSK